MTTYPALTVWQPGATLITVGAKPFEFRHWAAPRRLWGQRIAIHAGSRPMKRVEILHLCERLYDPAHVTGLRASIARGVLDIALDDTGAFPLASVLCIATLGEPIRNEALAEALGGGLCHDSTRDEHTNWGWPLTDIERLEPFVPARGHQGFWNWTR